MRSVSINSSTDTRHLKSTSGGKLTPNNQTPIWNPSTYLQFEAYRARPVEDFLPRISVNVDGPIFDLGCGPGNITLKLKQKWPEREVVGLDSSGEMLVEARKSPNPETITWTQGDITEWSAQPKAALVFANASLQWVEDHASLFPRLLENIAPGGVLAVQMPLTSDAPYQLCIRSVITSPKWKNKLKGVEPHIDAHAASYYYELLHRHCTTIDLWQTNYHHVLTGTDPVVNWMSGTGLRPILTQLNDKDRLEFLADYAAETRHHYAPQSDGKTLFTMRRLFILATHAG